MKFTKMRSRQENGNTPVLTNWGANSEYGILRDVLLGPPDYFHWLPTSSISRKSVRRGLKFDKDLAIKQWTEMKQAYEDAGVTVHVLEADENLPYQVFARDSSFITPYGAVVTQLAQWWRRGEYAPVIRIFQQLDIPIFDMITAGSLEGGDFNVIEPGCVLLGYCGERTQEQTAKQVLSWMEKEGWEVKLIDIDEFYVHIDLMVCMVAEKLAAVCLETTDPEVVNWFQQKKIEIIPVSFEDTMVLGCNVMALGKDKVISTATSKDLNARLRARGFDVYDPDMSMFTLGGGGVHCMAMHLRRDPA
jgi:N-dimethylarginine dimethylaminohydrolase